MNDDPFFQKYLDSQVKKVQQLPKVEAKAKISFHTDIIMDKNAEKKILKKVTLFAKTAEDKWAEQISLKLKPALDTAIRASWGWRDGSRDIVDTGELAKSLDITRSGKKISISYGTEYAALVHYGGYIQPYGNPSAESVYLPGRPWVAAVLGITPGPVQPLDMNAILQNLA